MEFLRNSPPFRSSAPNYFILTSLRTDIPEILSLANVFVDCPTTWLEGLGIAHLEAMAMGKPAVVSENGGLTDAALNGATGFVVPPGDVDRLSSAILRLLNEHELAQRMGTNARKRIEGTVRRPKKIQERWKRCLRIFSEESASIENLLTVVQQTLIS
jgi:glycosyltransferase involved in cell wall biosynthesis